MSTNIVEMKDNLPANTELDDLLGGDELFNDLSEGVKSGFGVISIRGSKWRVKKAGEEEPIVDENGDPKPSMEVVILKAAPQISKVYYAESFVEGSDAEPDCSSVNGVEPDAGVANPQAKTCAACVQNRWGSRITDSGKKSKACSDSRRVAIVPAGDLTNDVYGGPLMLRVPPASLNDLAVYGKRLGQKGIKYNRLITRLGFDLNTAYPKLTFKAVQMLNEDELGEIAEHFKDPDVLGRILEMPVAESTDAVPPADLPSVDVELEVQPELEVQEELDLEPAPAPKPAVKKKAVKKKAVVKKAAPATSEDDALDNELDNILGELDALS